MRILKSVVTAREEDSWASDGFDLQDLLSMTAESDACIQFGVAHFKKGTRQPVDGLTAHEESEISLVLQGSFSLETENGLEELGRGDLIVIPADTPHAATALEDARVYFVLVG